MLSNTMLTNVAANNVISMSSIACKCIHANILIRDHVPMVESAMSKLAPVPHRCQWQQSKLCCCQLCTTQTAPKICWSSPQSFTHETRGIMHGRNVYILGLQPTWQFSLAPGPVHVKARTLKPLTGRQELLFKLLKLSLLVMCCASAAAG